VLAAYSCKRYVDHKANIVPVLTKTEMRLKKQVLGLLALEMLHLTVISAVIFTCHGKYYPVYFLVSRL